MNAEQVTCEGIKKISRHLDWVVLLSAVIFGFILMLTVFVIGGIALTFLGNSWINQIGRIFLLGNELAIAVAILSLPGLRLTVIATWQDAEIVKRYSVFGITLQRRYWVGVRVRLRKTRAYGPDSASPTEAIEVCAMRSDGTSDVVLSVLEATIFGIKRFWTA